MDPMDFVLHGSSSRAPAHYDPVHAATAGPWMPHPQTSQAYQWSSHSSDTPLPFGLQRPHQVPDHFQHAQGGGLPPPGPGFRGMPAPEAHSGLSMPMRHWGHPMHQMPGLPPGPPPNHTANHMGIPTEPGFGLQPAASRSLGFQGGVSRPAAQSVGPAGVTPEHNQQPRWSFSSVPSAGAFGGQQNASSHASMPPLPFSSSPHRHTSHHHHHHSSSTSSHRNSHILFLPPPFSHSPHHSTAPAQPTSTPERRRSGHTRGRRSMASRMSVPDMPRGDDDGHHRAVTFETPPPGEARRSAGHNSHLSMSESDVRQMQMMRGLTSSKMVASKTTLRSLQSVKIEDLPANERTCVICYNDYGIETPEGVNEAPLQLPKCKHVFGDHCIKKWFEDSDSCPYCRDKVHSEPKRSTCSARAFINAMRVRGLSEDAQEELWARAMANSSHVLDIDLLAPMSERRAPPGDGGDLQRRTRARRSHSSVRLPSPPQTDDENAAAGLGDDYQRGMPRRVQWSSESSTGHRRSLGQNIFAHTSANELAEDRHWPQPDGVGALLRPVNGRAFDTHSDGHDGGQHLFRDQALPNPLQTEPLREPGAPRNHAMPEDWTQLTGVGAENRPTGSRPESTGHNHRPNRPW